MSVLEEKTSSKILGLSFSSILNCCSYIVSVAKTASNNIGALLRPTKYLYFEIALYLYKSTIQPCNLFHVWTGFFNCYLAMLHKLKKWVCKDCGSFT